MRTLTLLLLLLTCSLTATAQVGVNNPDPEQALDVEGKLKITDDGTTPTDGTMRYNSSEEAFEGFSAGAWQSFTKSAPTDVDFRQIYAFNQPANSDWILVGLEANPTSGNPMVFPAIPAGKKFLVDQIECVARDGQPNEFYYACVTPTSLPIGGENDLKNPRVYLSGNSSNGNTVIKANRAPLMVVHAGDGLAGWNSSTSETSVRIVIFGFMVDADSTDDYFSY